MGKNILLIIDPQNDFHEPQEDYEKPALPVENSNTDAGNIVKLINSDNFDEIHVSLDTHTHNHIGHPGFYEKGYVPLGFYDGSQNAKDTIDTKLTEYYLVNYNKSHIKKRGGNYQMWPVHCIENTEGHDIYPPIKEALGKKKVKYHIKGQNELTEMYSIFSATVDPESCCTMKQRYTGGNTIPIGEMSTYDIAEGLNSYEDACKHVNLNTKKNQGLIDNLLGPHGENTVYVCGQAKSHCVADSIIDLLEENKGTIILVDDASSPVIVPGIDLMKIAEGRIAEVDQKSNNNNYETKTTDYVLQEITSKDGGGKKRGKSRKLKRKSSRKTKKNNRTKKMIKKNKKGNNTRRRHR